MHADDPDQTLTAPMDPLAHPVAPALALTILWHPDLGRVGEQFMLLPGAGEVAVSRYAPLFSRPAGAQLPLGERSIGRDPVVLRLDGTTLRIVPPCSRMRIDVDGVPLLEAADLPAGRIGAGIVLALGGAVLLCLHWYRGTPALGSGKTLVGVGSAMRKVHEAIRQVAATEMPVLLLGESGTGKELVARAIHDASRRRGNALVAVNMAALNEALAAGDLFGATKGAYTGAHNARAGLFAEAQDGTLFLDEIGNTPAAIQPMLLRVLETGRYRPLGAARDVDSNARVIAATDQDLRTDSFNQPLFRRLEAFVIHLPPLRERREDIGVLIVHMMREQRHHDAATPLPVELVSRMCRHDWPGNVRQLGHAVRRALIAIQAGQFDDLAAIVPDSATAPPVAPMPPRPATKSARTRLSEVGDEAVLAALEDSGWRVGPAAQVLGISRPSMYKLLEMHPAIRAVATIPLEELRAALATHGGDLTRCAASLKTPSDALRRHLEAHGLIE